MRLLTCIFLALFASVSSAHGGATGIVKERMDSMSVMSKAAKSLGAMTRGKTEYDPNEVAALALAIARHADKIPGYFPDTKESRRGKGTEALPSIWENKPDFEAKAGELAEQGKALARLAAGGDRETALEQFRAIGKSCSGCHRDYRQKKKRKKH